MTDDDRACPAQVEPKSSRSGQLESLRTADRPEEKVLVGEELRAF